MYQAGTLSGNPVAMAAGLATLRAADDAVVRRAGRQRRPAGRHCSAQALTEAGVAHQVQRAGNMLSVFFTDAPVTDFASARASETWRFPPFFHALLDAGVYPPPVHSKPGSSRPLSTTTPSSASPMPCLAPPAPPRKRTKPA